jgi:hypothetical protein
MIQAKSALFDIMAPMARKKEAAAKADSGKAD